MGKTVFMKSAPKQGFKPVKSKAEGWRRAIKVWICADEKCEHWHYAKPRKVKECKKCHQKTSSRNKACPYCKHKYFVSQRPKQCEMCGGKHLDHFASVKEAERWPKLKFMLLNGEIRSLRRQVAFRIKVNGVEICKYVCDYFYYTADNRRVVEDVKGAEEAASGEFKMKCKLVAAIYGIVVKVIT